MSALDLLIDPLVLVRDLTQLGFVEGVKQSVVQLVCPVIVFLDKVLSHLPQRVEMNAGRHDDDARVKAFVGARQELHHQMALAIATAA